MPDFDLGLERDGGLTHVLDKGLGPRAWEELMPECLWKFRVKDFGPLTVGIDAHGNSLYRDVQTRARHKLEELYARL